MISKRKPPVNLDPLDDQFFQHEFEKTFPDHRVIHCRRALISAEGVVFEKNEIVEESLYAADQRKIFNGLYKLYYRGVGWLMNKKSDPSVLAFDAWSFGYFHWMTEFIPRLFKVRDLIGDRIVIVPHINNGIWNRRSALRSLFKSGSRLPDDGYYKESLEAFKIAKVYRHRPRLPLKVNDLCISGHLAISGNYDDAVMRDLRKFYFDYYNTGSTAPIRLVYVSRNLAARRHITNEAEVVDCLRFFGFEVFAFDNLPFRDQIKLLSETKFFISQHGAALTNLLFMQEQTCVMELKAEGDAQNLCYFSLASAMNVNYFYQFCKSDKRIPQDADITVDVEKLASIIKQVLTR